MRGFKGERIIASLLSLPRLNGKALMTALPVAIKRDAEKELYNNYVSECLRMTAENTAKFAGGKYIEKSFAEILQPRETKTADEIVRDVISAAGLKVIKLG